MQHKKKATSLKIAIKNVYKNGNFDNLQKNIKINLKNVKLVCKHDYVHYYVHDNVNFLKNMNSQYRLKM